MRPLILAALLGLPATLVAQGSTWIRVNAPETSATAAMLASAGFVIEPGLGEVEGKTDIILPDSDLPRFAALGIEYEVVDHSMPLRDRIRNGQRLDARYFTWGELNQYMLDVQNAHPSIAVRVNVTQLTGSPQTHEGRDVYALKISDNPGADDDEPNVLYVGNHHAREIATPHAMVDLMDHFTGEYASDPQVQQWVDENEIWIIPTMNPDGLEYVWNVNDYWRKNRRNNGGGIYGVDLNRNYPFKWAACGSYSHNTSSDVYAGPYAGSEPETQTQMNLARARNFVKVIDDHQYGREVLYPYTCASMPSVVSGKVNAVRTTLANAASYSYRLASAGGEHFEWEFQEIGALSYLFEINSTFHPTWSSSLAENDRVRPAMRAILDEPIPLAGNVYDNWTGDPIDGASVSTSSASFVNGEKRRSGGAHGRYHFWIGNGTFTFNYDEASYFGQNHTLTIGSGGLEHDVFLNPKDRPYIVLEGTPAVGNQVRFRVWNALPYAGMTASVLLSNANGGPYASGFNLPGGLWMPLDMDYLTNYSISNISRFQTSINGSGIGSTPYQTLPPAAAGLDVWASAVISDSGVHQIVTPAIFFQIP